MRSSLLSILALSSAVTAWLPQDSNLFGEQRSNNVAKRLSIGKGRSTKRFETGFKSKIRGVNLGSLFIVEPWMAGKEWASMGCGDSKSEFDCVSKLGQEAADKAFQKHWDTWITEEDWKWLSDIGINTVRIPVSILLDVHIMHSHTSSDWLLSRLWY